MMRWLTWTNARRAPGVLFVRAPLLTVLHALHRLGEWAQLTAWAVAARVPGWEPDDGTQ